MVTPVVLISASGMLTLSTTNRIGRVVDRVRELADQAEQLARQNDLPTDEVEEKRDHINDQLVSLVRRLRLLQSALTLLYSAIGLLLGTSLSIGIQSATHLLPEWVSIALGLAGAASLFTSSVLLVRETRVAVKATLIEMAHVRAVVARQTGRRVKE
jgi:hypothetical protein